MAKPNRTYQRLANKRWTRLGSVRAWRTADHLLLVENGFFSEGYTRLFWADIQTILLYRLPSRSVVLRALEFVCVSSLMISMVSWNLRPLFVLGSVFLVFYAAWRFRQPQWACQVSTRINLKKFVIPGTLSSCRRVVDEMKRHVSEVQGTLSGMPWEEAVVKDSEAEGIRCQGRPRPKQPVLVVHVIAFVLGLLTPFGTFLLVIYGMALIAAWFFQRDFRFPFAVRSAAVMSQMLAALQLLYWVLVKSNMPGMTPFSFSGWQFGLPRVLFSLYGIVAVYWGSMEQAKPQQKSATVLGLG